VAATREALGSLARYPDGGGFSLKQALAAKLHVHPENLTLGNGSNDVLELCARAFASPGDEVIYSQHSFAVYPIAVQSVGAQGVEVPASRYAHDLDAIAHAITPRTRIIYLANPNNPTGTWFNRAALDGFLASVSQRIVVVLDEAYFEYATDADFPNGIAFLARHANLVVTRTFSKAYGLAGLRIGYAVSSTAIADWLNRVRQPFNVNSLALVAAEAALADKEFVAHTRAANQDGMRALESGFARLGLPFIPSAANFICVEVGDAKTIYERLLRRGVIVRPVASYGLPRHLRVTVGTPDENSRFLTALTESLHA
jgi:histidinol-phosphate aminotransferase